MSNRNELSKKTVCLLAISAGVFSVGMNANLARAQGNAQSSMVCYFEDYNSRTLYFTETYSLTVPFEQLESNRQAISEDFRNFANSKGLYSSSFGCVSFPAIQKPNGWTVDSWKKYQVEQRLQYNFTLSTLGGYVPPKDLSPLVKIQSPPPTSGKRDSLIVRQPDEAPAPPVAQPAPKPVAKVKPVAKSAPKRKSTCKGTGNARICGAVAR